MMAVRPSVLRDQPAWPQAMLCIGAAMTAAMTAAKMHSPEVDSLDPSSFQILLLAPVLCLRGAN